MPDIVRRWLWGDPFEVLERIERSSGRMIAQPIITAPPPAPPPHDRYFTMARRQQVRRSCKGE